MDHGNEDSLNSTLSFLGHSSMDMSMGSSSNGNNDSHDNHNNNHHHTSTTFTPPSQKPPSMDKELEEEEIFWKVTNVRKSLRNAVIILNQYGLKLSSKWASEQLLGLATNSNRDDNDDYLKNGESEKNHESYSSLIMKSNKLSDREMHAKSLLDMGEYFRAAHVLSIKEHNQPGHHHRTMPPPLPNLNPIGIFYRAYALYMAGERRKEEEVVELRYVTT